MRTYATNLILVTAGLCLLAWRFVAYEKSHISVIPESWYASNQVLTGMVVDDPDRGVEKTKFTLLVQGSRILVSLPSGIPVRYGDRVTVSGMIKKPESFVTETGRTFDYANYLAVKEIYATLRAYDVTVIEHDQGSKLLAALYQTKYFFVRTLKYLFPHPQSGFLAGIVIGEQSLLPETVQQDFQVAGLTHMVVLSGYNITIVMLFFVTLGGWLGFGYRAKRIFAMIAIPIFLVMTGLGASSLRAGVMAILMVFAQINTRPASNIRIICITLFAMLMNNPRILLHDPSFHLSFLAFLGLVFVGPIVAHYTERLSELWGLRNLVFETFAVQLFVMPYMLFMNGAFSWLLLMANVVTVPMIPILMGTGFAAIMIGMIWFPLGYIMAIPVSWGLSYVLWIAHFIATQSWAITTIPPFNIWWMGGIYAAMIVSMLWWYLRQDKKTRIIQSLQKTDEDIIDQVTKTGRYIIEKTNTKDIKEINRMGIHNINKEAVIIYDRGALYHYQETLKNKSKTSRLAPLETIEVIRNPDSILPNFIKGGENSYIYLKNFPSTRLSIVEVVDDGMKLRVTHGGFLVKNMNYLRKEKELKKSILEGRRIPHESARNNPVISP